MAATQAKPQLDELQSLGLSLRETSITELRVKRSDLIDSRFKELLEFGTRVLTTRRPPPAHVSGDSRIDMQQSQQWITSTSQFLGSLFGRDSEYYRHLEESCKYPGYYSDMARGMAVLNAAWNDYSSGYIFELKMLVRAEIFDDFLELAQYMYDQGYYQPAAVLAGGVLEDSLRKLCDKNKVAIPAKPKLDTMNSELAKNGAYNTLVQKRITWLADIRNKAAHGQWSTFTATDVDNMLRQVRDFVTDHLA